MVTKDYSSILSNYLRQNTGFLLNFVIGGKTLLKIMIVE